MIDLLPAEERRRRKFMRTVGYWCIAATYLTCIGLFLFGYARLQGYVVLSACILPIILQLGIISRETPYEDHPGIYLLFVEFFISLSIAAIYGIYFGSDTVRMVIIWAGLFIIALVAVFGTVNWMRHEKFRKRLSIVLIFSAALILILLASYGTPMIRWISVGVGAAILFSFSNPAFMMAEVFCDAEEVVEEEKIFRRVRADFDHDRSVRSKILDIDKELDLAITIDQARNFVEFILRSMNEELPIEVRSSIDRLMTAVYVLVNFEILSVSDSKEILLALRSIEQIHFKDKRRKMFVGLFEKLSDDFTLCLSRVRAHRLVATNYELEREFPERL